MSKRRAWDVERARELYDEGLDDESIADMVGTTASAVQGWRSKSGLPRRRGKAERFTLAEAAEAADVQEGDDTLSVTAGAVPPPPRGEARGNAAGAVPPPMGPPAQTSEAFALGRGEAAQRMSPRTYAGANDTKLASTKGEASDYEIDTATAPPPGEVGERKPSQTPPVAAPAPPEGEPEREETPERIGGDDVAKLYINVGLIAGVAVSVPQELRRALKNVELDMIELAHKLEGEVWRC